MSTWWPMKTRILHALLLSLCLLAACNRDPEAAKRKYVENGNKYFEREKYKEALIMYRKAIQQDAKYGEAYYRSGLAELKVQNFAQALRNFQRAVENQPGNLDAHVKLANIYLTAYTSNPKRANALLGELKSITEKVNSRFSNTFDSERLSGFVALFGNDIPAAATHFEKANKLKPEDAELVLAYMQVLAASGRAADGEKLGLDLLAKQPNALALYDALFVHYMRTGRKDEAERLLRTKVDKNPKIADARLQLAGHYFATNRRPEMLELLKQVSDNPKDFPEGSKMVGDFFLRIRENDLALQKYQEGISRSPKDKHLYQKRMAEVFVRQNKRDEAMKLVGEILKEDAKDNEALAMRGSLNLMGGSPEQIQSAINDLQTVATKTPDNVVVKYNLGRAHLAKRNLPAARTQFEDAVKLQPEYLAARVALADVLTQQKEYAKAIQATQEVFVYDPNNVPARLLRSRALIAQGDLKQARAELQKTTSQHPNIPEAKLQLATLDLSERNFKAAEGSFRQIYSTSQDPRAFLGLVDSLVAQNQVPAAMKTLRDELEKNPKRLDYRATLGNLALMTKDTNTAVTEFKKVLESAPKSADTWIRLSEAYRIGGDINQTIASLKKAQEAAPNDARPALQLALIYDTSGQKGQAKPMYEQALRLNPTHPVALNNLAFILADSGQDLDQALTMAQKAKQQFPKDVNISDTLGWIYIKKNLPDSAINIYKDLVAQQPTRATFRYHFGMALVQKGDKATAKKELEAALRSKPLKDEEERIRELINKLG